MKAVAALVACLVLAAAMLIVTTVAGPAFDSRDVLATSPGGSRSGNGGLTCCIAG